MGSLSLSVERRLSTPNQSYIANYLSALPPFGDPRLFTGRNDLLNWGGDFLGKRGIRGEYTAQGKRHFAGDGGSGLT